MLDARFQSLEKWPDKHGRLGRLRAAFKTPYNKTLDKLEYELGRLGAKNISFEAGYKRTDLRNDGWPRGGTHAIHPGVILHFETKTGPMSFPAGTYSRIEDNMHAIALTLECLRAVDRYGVTQGTEQYQGFLALPAPASSADAWTVDSAAGWLATQVGWATQKQLLESQESYKTAYRQVAAKTHPDTASGSREQFDVLQTVARLLDQFHKTISKETTV